MNRINSVIIGTGNYIPEVKKRNEDFFSNDFYDAAGTKIEEHNKNIISKFEEITTISERRYAADNQATSDLSFIAAQRAIEAAGIDQESLDYIIVAHNFGETRSDNNRVDVVPSIASRVKKKLGINNPYTVAYDILFGCPGWVQAVIQADYYLRSGDAKRALVIGSDVLSRIADPHDRDSLIYADGAGAIILEAQKSDEPGGILGHITRTDALDYADLLHMGYSYNLELAKEKNYYLKMSGRRLYQYALQHVPKTIKELLDRLNIDIKQVKKVLIHQANGKMDDAILERLFRLYNIREIPTTVMPMTISWLGNSSVATIPTLLDMITRGEMEGHSFSSGDHIVMASVGAGMNINSIVYKQP